MPLIYTLIAWSRSCCYRQFFFAVSWSAASWGPQWILPMSTSMEASSRSRSEHQIYFHPSLLGPSHSMIRRPDATKIHGLPTRLAAAAAAILPAVAVAAAGSTGPWCRRPTTDLCLCLSAASLCHPVLCPSAASHLLLLAAILSASFRRPSSCVCTFPFSLERRVCSGAILLCVSHVLMLIQSKTVRTYTWIRLATVAVARVVALCFRPYFLATMDCVVLAARSKESCFSWS